MDEKLLQERLEATAIFYRDKARQKENAEKATFYEAYAAGITRALAEMNKLEGQERSANEVCD